MNYKKIAAIFPTENQLNNFRNDLLVNSTFSSTSIFPINNDCVMLINQRGIQGYMEENYKGIVLITSNDSLLEIVNKIEFFDGVYINSEVFESLNLHNIN